MQFLTKFNFENIFVEKLFQRAVNTARDLREDLRGVITAGRRRQYENQVCLLFLLYRGS